MKQRIFDIIKEAILREYHDELRIPFEETGYGHGFVDEFIDWIQYSSEKGVLPAPKITFKQGILQGCEEYAKYDGCTSDSVVDYMEMDSELMECMDELKFDKNGNLYVERAMRLGDIPDDEINHHSPSLYRRLIDKYEKNVGGCWSYRPGYAADYCGSQEGMWVLLQGYMSLDDILWPEFIRLDMRGVSEYEVRTKPNGRVMLTGIVLGGNKKKISYKEFDGPRILRQTFFGNNENFHGNLAKIGLQKINYDKQYIDREGNEYSMDEMSQVLTREADKILKNATSYRGRCINFDYSDELDNGYAVVALNGRCNIITPDNKVLMPDLWVDRLERVGSSENFIIRLGDKYNILLQSGKLAHEYDNMSMWYDQVTPIYNRDYRNRYIEVYYWGGGEHGDLQANMLDMEEDKNVCEDYWFDNVHDIDSQGFVLVLLNGKYNFMDLNGKILYIKDGQRWNTDNWFISANGFKNNGMALVVTSDGQKAFLNTKGELLDKKTVNHDLIERLKTSNDPLSLFDSYDDGQKYGTDLPETSGFYKVFLNGEINFLKPNRELVSPDRWFTNASAFFLGTCLVGIDGNMFYIDPKGNILSDGENFKIRVQTVKNVLKHGISPKHIMIHDYDMMVSAVGKIRQNVMPVKIPYDSTPRFNGTMNKYNLVRTDNFTLVSPMWFDDMRLDDTREYYIPVYNRRGKYKFNIINPEGKFVSPNMWFDGVEGVFFDKTAFVSMDGAENVLRVDTGKLLSQQWADQGIDIQPDGTFIFNFNKGQPIKMDVNGRILDSTTKPTDS